MQLTFTKQARASYSHPTSHLLFSWSFLDICWAYIIIEKRYVHPNALKIRLVKKTILVRSFLNLLQRCRRLIQLQNLLKFVAESKIERIQSSTNYVEWMLTGCQLIIDKENCTATFDVLFSFTFIYNYLCIITFSKKKNWNLFINKLSWECLRFLIVIII